MTIVWPAAKKTPSQTSSPINSLPFRKERAWSLPGRSYLASQRKIATLICGIGLVQIDSHRYFLAG